MGLTVMRVNLQRILRTRFAQRALLEGTQGASQAGNERGTPGRVASGTGPALPSVLSTADVWTPVTLFTQPQKWRL